MRGAALLGIVVVNAEFILQHANLGWQHDQSVPDLITRWLVTTFGVLKVYPLFALLFGYGLSVQLDRASQRGGSIGWRYGRRLAGLAVLGVLHAILFFPGDILVVYAVVGLLAYLLRRRSSASLVRIAVAVYASASALWLLAGVVFLVTGTPLAEPVTDASQQVLARGSFAEVIEQHRMMWPETLVAIAIVQGPAALACALVGVALGRTDVLINQAAYRGRARRVLIAAGSLGFVGAAVGATLALQSAEFAALGLLVGFVAAPAVAASYVAALMLTWNRLPAFFSALLQASGRMSLSVYLLMSVVLSTLAYGYGAGLSGQLSPPTGVLLAVGVWGGLSVFATLWLRFARFGPAEWLLRSCSYWRLQPLSRHGSS